MRRVVVKLGSSIVAHDDGSLREDVLQAVCHTVADQHDAGTEVVIVTSGAIARGMQVMGLGGRPAQIGELQAASAVGQGKLYHVYDELLRARGVTSAQVLLTFFDVSARMHYLNARETLRTLLDWKVVPVINENDTVGTQEIRFGDNDHLAALVAQLVHADVLVLLSDVDGIYTKPPTEPGAERIELVPFGHLLDHVEFGSIGSAGVGSGGAGTKAAAAQFAAESGTAVLITNAALVASALRGENVGTWFDAAS